jgi:hypothetical protein
MTARRVFDPAPSLRVDTPQAVSVWAEAYRRDDHDATRALTDDMGARLRGVSPDYGWWVAAETFGELAEVVDRPMGAIPAEVDLVRRERLARVLAEASGPTDALQKAFDRYQRDLDLLGLSDARVCASYRSGHLRFIQAWALAKVVAAAPFAAVGAVVHAVPYQIMKKLGTLPADEGVKATVKLRGCFASFTCSTSRWGSCSAPNSASWRAWRPSSPRCCVGTCSPTGAPSWNWLRAWRTPRACRTTRCRGIA